VAVLSNEGPGEALKVVLLLLLVHFSFLPLALLALGFEKPLWIACTSRDDQLFNICSVPPCVSGL
jgi:hypothetical protein